jgi:hypothetical protein
MCPFCKKNCHDLVTDKLLQNIIDKWPNRLKSVMFSADGSYKPIENIKDSSVSIDEPTVSKRVKK